MLRARNRTVRANQFGRDLEYAGMRARGRRIASEQAENTRRRARRIKRPQADRWLLAINVADAADRAANLLAEEKTSPAARNAAKNGASPC